MLNKRIILVIFFLIIDFYLVAQKIKLPLLFLSQTDTTKPLIFYISGDGGLNKFSVSFMQALNKKGYTVMGLDSKDYFWKPKKPDEAAHAIELAISELNKQNKMKEIVLIGYSFGADVAPFILTHFSPSFSTKVNHLILLSPSKRTDFETHILQMLGWGSNSGESVVAEINKISKPVTIVMGGEENEFPLSQLTIKNKDVIKMTGGHHYDNEVDSLCSKIILRIK